MIAVHVISSNKLIQKALYTLLKEEGFAASETMSNADVSLVHLSLSIFPFPAPPEHIPSLALVPIGIDPVSLLKLGYTGYLEANVSPVMLVKALEVVAGGEYWARREDLSRLLNASDEATLTAREQETYEYVLQGISNRNIATLMKIKEGTVKAHISSLFVKLKSKSRVELILKSTAYMRKSEYHKMD